MQMPEMAPLWDEAIAGLLTEDQAALGAPLTLERLQELAHEHTIRLGDILETLYLLAIYGDWSYTDSNGAEKQLDEKALDDLYAIGRVSQEDLSAFDGLWQPV